MSKSTPRRLGILAAIIVAFCGMVAAPALAHAELKKSTPAKGATVHELTEVSLVFTERVQLARVKVSDAAGKDVQAGSPQVQGDTITQAVSGGDLASGQYVLAYRVVSADGHPVEGTVPFKFATSQGPAQATGPEQPGATDANNTASNGGQRWLLVGAGLLVGIGIGGGIVFLRRGKTVATGGTTDAAVGAGERGVRGKGTQSSGE